jgi:hypothetical protein
MTLTVGSVCCSGHRYGMGSSVIGAKNAILGAICDYK